MNPEHEALFEAEGADAFRSPAEEALLQTGTQAGCASPEKKKKNQHNSFKSKWKKNKSLVPFVLPAIIFALIFSYLPMCGLLIAFKDNINFIRYGNPLEAFANAGWTTEHFAKIFSDPDILKYIANTLIISVLKIVILFPLPVVLAIMITEATNKLFSKCTQMAVFLPHFLSWVVVVGIFKNVLAIDGPVNTLLIKLGMMSKDSPTYWFGTDSLFRGLVVFINGWKEIGYSSIVYVSAIMAIDPHLYEAAKLDGAGKFRQIWSITLPSILPTIITMLIIRVGYLMDAGFDQIYAMISPTTRNSGEIIGTYVYRISLGENAGQYGLSTAVGLFNGIVSLVLILATNWISKKTINAGIF